MSSRLMGYLLRIAVDPALYAEFVAEPDGAAERAGLTPEERAVLLSGDQNRIYEAVAAGRATEAESSQPSAGSS